jgi:hypothetical protein
VGVLPQHPGRPDRTRRDSGTDAQGRRQGGSTDLLGAVTVAAGLAVAVYSIVRAPETGWGSAQTVIGLVAALVLLGAFLVLQAKRGNPLMRLGIFRTHNLGAANIAQLLLGGAWIPMWFFLSLYLQQVLGLGAFASCGALQPMTTVTMLIMITVAPRLMGRFGRKR